MNVASVRESEWKKDDGTVVKVTNVAFDDGTEAPGYDLPAPPEIGKPLPAGWELAQSKAGKTYIKVPKGGKGGGFGGGATAHRNTKEGQAFEEERKDRRTALMQAIVVAPNMADVLVAADALYAWLRSSPGVEASPPAPGGSTVGGGGQRHDGDSTVRGDISGPGVTPPTSSDAPVGGGVVTGEGAASPSHEHIFNPIREGSTIYRCSVTGCPVTEKR